MCHDSHKNRRIEKKNIFSTHPRLVHHFLQQLLKDITKIRPLRKSLSILLFFDDGFQE